MQKSKVQESMVKWDGEKLSKDHRILPVTLYLNIKNLLIYLLMLALLPLPSQTLQHKMYVLLYILVRA